MKRRERESSEEGPAAKRSRELTVEEQRLEYIDKLRKNSGSNALCKHPGSYWDMSSYRWHGFDEDNPTFGWFPNNYYQTTLVKGRREDAFDGIPIEDLPDLLHAKELGIVGIAEYVKSPMEYIHLFEADRKWTFLLIFTYKEFVQKIGAVWRMRSHCSLARHQDESHFLLSDPRRIAPGFVACRILTYQDHAVARLAISFGCRYIGLIRKDAWHEVVPIHNPPTLFGVREDQFVEVHTEIVQQLVDEQQRQASNLILPWYSARQQFSTSLWSYLPLNLFRDIFAFVPSP
jgi:hypothetical protein